MRIVTRGRRPAAARPPGVCAPYVMLSLSYLLYIYSCEECPYDLMGGGYDYKRALV